MVEVKVAKTGPDHAPILELWVDTPTSHEQIGTIHFGTESNCTDATLLHLNIDPRLWGSNYRVNEVKVNGDRIYVALVR